MARKAYEYALDLLAARAYTTRNLRRKLMQKSFDPDEIAAATERLLEAGLLDDRRYAADYARQKLALGGSAVRRIRQALAQRGVAGEDVQAAIESVLEEEPVDIRRSIDQAARKKLASMGDLEPQVRKRRLFAFLARRGFGLADIQAAVADNLPSDER